MSSDQTCPSPVRPLGQKCSSNLGQCSTSEMKESDQSNESKRRTNPTWLSADTSKHIALSVRILLQQNISGTQMIIINNTVIIFEIRVLLRNVAQIYKVLHF